MMIPVAATRFLSGRPAACRWSTVLFAVAALLLMGALSAAGEPRPPRLVLPEPKFDFGTVPAGQVAEHVFEIRNGGDAVLEIRKVQPT
jgi:hypothetical protein